MHVQPCNVDYRFSSFTKLNLSEVHRRRINKWTGLDGPGATQQLWRQIFPFWISRTRNGVFAEETERRFVPFPNRSALQSLPARPDPTPPHSTLPLPVHPEAHCPTPSAPCESSSGAHHSLHTEEMLSLLCCSLVLIFAQQVRREIFFCSHVTDRVDLWWVIQGVTQHSSLNKKDQLKDALVLCIASEPDHHPESHRHANMLFACRLYSGTGFSLSTD